MPAQAISIQLVPLADVVKVRDALATTLVDALARRLNIPTEQVKLRNILPKTDLDLTYENWANKVALAAQAWTNYVDVTVHEQRFIGFYGAINLTPDPGVVGIRFNLGAVKVIDVWQFEEAYGYRQIPSVISFEPIIYAPRQACRIEVYNRKGTAIAVGQERLVLLGYTAEPVGLVTL